MARLSLSFCAFLLLLVCSGAVSAQGGVERVTTIKNEAITYQFLSRFAPVVGRQPGNGTVEMIEDPVFNYTLTYTPDTDFVGTDGFLLVSFPFGYSVAFTEITVSVEEAVITANHDFVQTAHGQPVRIPVTENDYTNTGMLSLKSTPVVNGGTVSVDDQSVVFTPAAGFTGLADFNYVVCTYGDACDLGTVTVNVLPPVATEETDTIRVFTKRDQAQFIFAPEGATPLNSPANGEMARTAGVMTYRPNEGFVGDEFLTYRNPGSTGTTTFHLSVLDLVEKKFTTEDRAYTAVDASTRIKVLPNDLYSVFADCVTFDAPRFGSLTETNTKGEVIYHPPAGWSGVDQFTYSSQAPGCEGPAELQTVYVFVSNFAPAADELQLTAPAAAPLKVSYDVPGGAATWRVERPARFGTLTADPVSGDIIYTPLPTAAGQVDEFELTYCLNADATGECQFKTSVPVRVNVTAVTADGCIDEDCVWPGDTNKDGVVDVGDLLPIGLAMGRFGTPRLSADETAWSAQMSEDWEQSINGVNLKHVDANGDQVISHLDTAVVLQNLDLSHRLRPTPQTFSKFDISLRGTLEAAPGDLIKLDIMAGSNVVIVEDVYGFIFPFSYDPNVVDGNNVDISFGEESWAGYDSPIISVQDNNISRGRVEAAVTRTNGQPISGFGKVGELSVVIVEDVYGFIENPDERTAETTVTLGGETATVMNGAGHLDAVNVRPFELKIKRGPAVDVGDLDPATASDFLNDKLIAYPNPTAGQLTVHLNGQQRFSALTLTDLTGRTLYDEAGLDTNHRELNLAGISNGIYTLTLTTDDGVVNRKVRVQR